MDIKLKDLLGISLEEANCIYSSMNFAFNIKDGKLKGVIIEN